MTPEPIVTVAQEQTNRKAQREKLARFFRENPNTIYLQETLADAAGCAVSTVRSRISELIRKDKLSLRWHQSGYIGSDGHAHIECKRWEFVERPPDPLGRDAGSPVARTLFPLNTK